MNATGDKSASRFIIRSEAVQAAHSNGYRVDKGEENGWLRFGSTTAAGDIWISADSAGGLWHLATNHAGVVDEMDTPRSSLAGPGLSRYSVATPLKLHGLIERCYQLGISLPNLPLEVFRKRTAGLPKTTEAEQLYIRRIGQDVFRDALLEYWGGRCLITGISHPALLRASHIVPWAESDDEQRLDVHNGLLLSSLWDAAFDNGLISFSDDGQVLVSQTLTSLDLAVLMPTTPAAIPLTDKHRVNLASHRYRNGFT